MFLGLIKHFTSLFFFTKNPPTWLGAAGTSPLRATDPAPRLKDNLFPTSITSVSGSHQHRLDNPGSAGGRDPLHVYLVGKALVGAAKEGTALEAREPLSARLLSDSALPLQGPSGKETAFLIKCYSASHMKDKTIPLKTQGRKGEISKTSKDGSTRWTGGERHR